MAGPGRPRGRHLISGLTHHVEVIGAALGATVQAGQQHVFDVVARPVVELAHVEGAGLVAVEVGPLLQDLQDVFLNQVWVSDLVPERQDPVLIIYNYIISDYLNNIVDPYCSFFLILYMKQMD